MLCRRAGIPVSKGLTGSKGYDFGRKARILEETAMILEAKSYDFGSEKL
jgi:hypothetical protein